MLLYSSKEVDSPQNPDKIKNVLESVVKGTQGNYNCNLIN